jgi:hypothetical protein
MQKRLVFAVVLGLATFACGKKADSTAAPAPAGSAATVANGQPAPAAAKPASDSDGPSCKSKEGFCVEWTGLAITDLKDAMQSCQEPGDDFEMHGCATQNLIGTCDHPSDKTKMYLYKSDVIGTVAEAKAFCDDGVFAPAAKPAKQASRK